MDNFVFQNKTKIIFGQGTEAKVGKEVVAYGKKVLLHYGGGSIKKSGLYERVLRSLAEANITVFELGGVKPNPRLSLVREGVEICRENQIEVILAVGGGSVIDSAKAIAMGVPYKGDPWDFFTGKAPITEALPIGVVLTIPAAGSEASRNTVITNEEGWFKKGCGSEVLRPQFAIMNPELTYTLPPFQTACGAVDIMAHVMERYFTQVKGVDLTDRLCEATLKSLIKNVPIVLKDPDNYTARAEVMWAGTIAHNDLLGTGRVGDWATHLIEHEISGIYDVAHGAGLAIMFPAWMKYVYKENQERFIQFATRVWDVEYSADNPEEVALEGIKRMTRFFRDIGLETTLTELKIPADKFEEMADKCTKGDTIKVGNFKKLDKQDIINIYNLAL